LLDSPKNVICTVNDYAGRFTGVDCNYIQGWAWDKNFPNAAVTVEVYEGSIVYATAVANIYLEDLKNSGTGTGNYGFKIATPASLRDGKAHQLSMRVKGASSVLSTSSQNITCAANEYAGRLKGADCDYIQGWAWDKNAPDGAVTVEVYEGSTVHATAVANIYREDVKVSGIGTGYYGFKIPTPLSLKDGKSHPLSVRVKGSSTILTDSPKSVTCVGNQYAGRLKGADCNYIQGWAWDKNFPDVAVTVEIYEGSTVYATAVADIYREDVKASGIGTGYYGFKISTPSTLKDGKAHQLSVRVKGSATVLLDSPKIITCAASARLAAITEAQMEPEAVEAKDLELFIAPNPTNGKLVATFSLKKNQTASLAVMNTQGQVVWTQSAVGQHGTVRRAVDVSNHENGVYFFQLIIKGQIQTKRFVLIR
ncbi:T9SS type A sorting domain-containing protein, partial [Dyadobacter sp. CY323]|uniref:T9SS type A sorting domain-containing protein n=1 Tax=Dyadobacter sp. CY323 TaxID=2907302 RepID=UPI001F21E80D